MLKSSALLAAVLLLIVCSASTGAFGDDGLELVAKPDAGAKARACRVEVLPAWATTVEREVVIPALTHRVCTPIYESIQVPVFERRSTPRYETKQVPTYAWRRVPVYGTRRTAVWGTQRTPIKIKVRQPTVLPVWTPFQCKPHTIELWSTCKEVEVGAVETAVIKAYRPGHVAYGLRRERYVVSTRTERIQVGEDVEIIQVGTRPERHLRGYSTEVIIDRIAETRLVEHQITLPSERVTVAEAGARDVAPLKGTQRVLSEAEYKAAVADRVALGRE